jgi:hypothetical protein
MQDFHGETLCNCVILTQIHLLSAWSFPSKVRHMNADMKELIDAVKQSSKPVEEVVDTFFANIGWSLLKQEYDSMTSVQRRLLISTLTTERNT